MKEKRRIKVGQLRFKLSTLTLQQIYEAGNVFASLKSDNRLPALTNAIAEVLANCDDARMMQEVSLIVLFRSRILRRLMRPYVRHHLTTEVFQDILTALTESKTPALFVYQIILLKDTNSGFQGDESNPLSNID